MLPDESSYGVGDFIHDPIEQYFAVKASGLPNFLGARIPLCSQLNINICKQVLGNYWDKQLIHLLEFGFPLDFNRSYPLKHEGKYHSSATDHPIDIEAFVAEEKQYGAIIGPFDVNPIPNCHTSPFMTRDKPNAPTRRVTMDLSWPKEASVNAGVDKNSYLGSEFALTFPTIDDLTKELVRIGPGAHIYKIDISRAFQYLKIDPLYLDLLGLQWNDAYINTCLPFGGRHGSQNISVSATPYITHYVAMVTVIFLDTVRPTLRVVFSTVCVNCFNVWDLPLARRSW